MGNDTVLKTRAPRSPGSSADTEIDAYFGGGQTRATTRMADEPIPQDITPGGQPAPSKSGGRWLKWAAFAAVIMAGAGFAVMFVPTEGGARNNLAAQAPRSEQSAPSVAPPPVIAPPTRAGTADPAPVASELNEPPMVASSARTEIAAPASGEGNAPPAVAPRTKPESVPSIPGEQLVQEANRPSSADDSRLRMLEARLDAVERAQQAMATKPPEVARAQPQRSANKPKAAPLTHQATPPTPAATTTDLTRIPPGSSPGYVLRAIVPGQAWIELPNGKVEVVSEGSTLSNGVRVLQIDADRAQVHTTIGVVQG